MYTQHNVHSMCVIITWNVHFNVHLGHINCAFQALYNCAFQATVFGVLYIFLWTFVMPTSSTHCSSPVCMMKCTSHVYMICFTCILQNSFWRYINKVLFKMHAQCINDDVCSNVHSMWLWFALNVHYKVHLNIYYNAHCIYCDVCLMHNQGSLIVHFLHL
jgi:hypothetical protein